MIARTAVAILAVAFLGFGCRSDDEAPAISGVVSIQGAGLAEVTVSLSGAMEATTATDASGRYRFPVGADATYSVSPAKAGYVFSPAARPVAVGNLEASGNDFAGKLAPVPEAIELPQTGQVLVRGKGDDGDVRAGVPWPHPRFADNGDGTVGDRLTGLVWLKNADCHGTKNWDGALAAANGLAAGACGLADGSRPGDWRLPNINEIASLISLASILPAIPTTAGSTTFANVRSTYYWSSTTTAATDYYAWMAYLDMGYLDVVSKVQALHVWPVRDGAVPGTIRLPRTGQTVSYAVGDDGYLQAGAAWPQPRFTDNRDGTITDRLTALVWLRNANCLDETVAGVSKQRFHGLLIWTQALSWTGGLASGSCGLTDGSRPGDWRLPNRNEVASLVDRSRVDPALSAGGLLDNVDLDGYWSASSLPPYPPPTAAIIPWFVYMGDARVTVGQVTGYSDLFYVLPLRSRRP